MKKPLLGLVSAALLVAGAVVAAAPDPDTEVLVGFHPGATTERGRQVAREHGGTSTAYNSYIRVHKVTVKQSRKESFKVRVRGQREVAFVEDNQLHQITLTPNDPLFTASGSYLHNKIGTPTAWNTTTGSSSVTIAILDTGVTPVAELAAGRMVAGYNFYSNNTDTSDVHGHGTKVASVAAAAGNNATGITGICWSCKVMPIRVTDPGGFAYTSAVTDGITFAANNGAKVINISIGGVASSPTVKSAAEYARSRGLLVVAGSGNCAEGTAACNDATPANPAIISVGATTSTDALAGFSVKGAYVDISAPGASVYTATRSGTYVTASGTSYSGPVVAGVLALMFSANANLTVAAAEQALIDNVDDRGTTGWDNGYGWGRVNAARAVAAVAGTPAPPTDTQNPVTLITAPAAGATLSGIVTVTASASDNAGIASVALLLDGLVYATDVSAPYTFSLSTAGLSAGTHTLQTRATDTSGNVGTSASQNFTVLAREIILDNAGRGVTGGGRSFTGTWCVSVSTGFYGTGSLYSCGSGTDTYRWTPTIPATRSYDVYVRWTTHANRSTAVPISVTHAGGTTTRTYNEKVGGGVWTLHGRYTLNAGTSGYVQVTDTGGQANADAVKFVPAP